MTQHHHSETSIAAYEAIKAFAPSVREEVFDCISFCPSTCFEVEEALESPHQTVSARITELRQAGRVVDSGIRRRSIAGRNSIVWKVAA